MLNVIAGERGPRIDLPGTPGVRGESGSTGDPGKKLIHTVYRKKLLSFSMRDH